MTARMIIDFCIIAYNNTKINYNKMKNIDELNENNILEHMNYFYLFVINIKVLNDSLIYYNYNKNKSSDEHYNIKKELEKLLENGVLEKDDIKKIDNLKEVRDYFIHQKEIPSILMGQRIVI